MNPDLFSAIAGLLTGAGSLTWWMKALHADLKEAREELRKANARIEKLYRDQLIDREKWLREIVTAAQGGDPLDESGEA